MANEEEEAGMPSAPRRREVELGRGVVILPPERIKQEKREEQKAEAAPAQPTAPAQKRQEAVRIQGAAPALAPNYQTLMLIGLAVVAVIAIVMSFIAMTSVASLKSELRGISADLKEFSMSQLTVRATLDSTHSIESSVPLKETIAPFNLPIPQQDIEGTGSITVILPGYNYPITIPWNGTLTVLGSVTVNTTQLSDERKLILSYNLPGTGEMTMKIPAGDLFNVYLGNITARLERLSR